MKFLADLAGMDSTAFTQGAMAGGLAGGFIAAIMAFFLIFLIIGVALYVYMSLAYMAIARKDKQSSPGLAWIPYVGAAIVAFRGSGMHWWPWLLLIGCFIPVISGIFVLAFLVFFIIWSWKTFEAIGKPGWWSILMIIPIVNLVILGIVAWSK